MVFQRDSLNFVPGSTVTLYKGPEYPIFLASGIQEPWLRLILRKDIFSLNFGQVGCGIKLNLDVVNKLPSLMSEKNPHFIFDTQTIGAFFSWASTNPEAKCKVCYLGQDKIQEDWISTYHTVVKPSDVLKMKKVSNLYISGDRDLFVDKAKKLIDKCKGSLLIG